MQRDDFDDYDYAYEADQAERAREAYEAQLIDDALRTISTDAAVSYLGRHGDAIDTRVSACIAEARLLLVEGHPGSALALATTGLELMLRFMLVRPLVPGVFLSDEWADILSTRIGPAGPPKTASFSQRSWVNGVSI